MLNDAEAKSAELERLRRAEEAFRSVAQSATDAIVTADEAGRIVFWNRAAERLFGHGEAEVLGQPLTLIIPDRHQGAHDRGMARVQSGGPHHVIGRTVELEARRRDGSEFPVELSLASWKAEGARFFSGIIRDVSDRRAAEERLRAFAARLDEDLEQADAFQRALLQAPERWRGFEIGVLYLPAERVGGDFYDVHETPDGRLRGVLVDATGHGIQASLRTMIVKTVLEKWRRETLSPAEVLAALNDDMVALGPDLSLRSAAACFDLDEQGQVRVANAGLMPVRLSRPDFVEEVHTGPFLGMVAGARFEDRHLALGRGERLYLYTDGLVEGAIVEEDAIFAALGSGTTARDGIAALAALLAPPLADDVTVLSLRSTG